MLDRKEVVDSKAGATWRFEMSPGGILGRGTAVCISPYRCDWWVFKRCECSNPEFTTGARGLANVIRQKKKQTSK